MNDLAHAGCVFLSLVGSVYSLWLLWRCYLAFWTTIDLREGSEWERGHAGRVDWYCQLISAGTLLLVSSFLLVGTTRLADPAIGHAVQRELPPSCFVTTADLHDIPPTRLALASDRQGRPIAGADLAGLLISDAELRELLKLAPEIEFLILTGTRITDDVLVDLKRMPHLTRLTLADSAVTDAGLAQLAGMENLEYLSLGGTSVSDEGLAHLTTMPNLRELQLQGTLITDAGLVSLKSMSQLEYVSLSRTAVTRFGAEQLQASMPKLKAIGYGSSGLY